LGQPDRPLPLDLYGGHGPARLRALRRGKVCTVNRAYHTSADKENLHLIPLTASPCCLRSSPPRLDFALRASGSPSKGGSSPSPSTRTACGQFLPHPLRDRLRPAPVARARRVD